MEHQNPHFLLVTYPAQGHINPTLQFAKNLMRTGAQVTFATSISAQRRMGNTPIPNGLTYAPFSDGYDDGFDGFKPSDDPEHYNSVLKQRGSEALTTLMLDLPKVNRKVTCLIYTLLLPWAADVARDLNIPSALLWIQPATVFDIYYYYFSGYSDVIIKKDNESSSSIELPGLKPLSSRDIPSFLLLSNPHKYFLSLFKEQFQALEREKKPRVLVNTFDALESDGLKAIDKVQLVGIGPLIPSAFLDEREPSDNSFRWDLFRPSTDYINWLNSMPKTSVIYVCFGSTVVLQQRQMEEIAVGLVESGRPYLWVIRKSEEEKEEERENNDRIVRIVEGAKKEGMIVSWCSQLEVLSHASLGCFVTHCGWNSTLESLATGVPVVALPQWSDQTTNAKLIEDVWKTGVRVRKKEEKEGIVESGEIKRCLRIVMDEERGEEMRRNAKKWRDLAREAVKDGGSSDKNLREFVDVVARD